jgi:hypothetical protein
VIGTNVLKPMGMGVRVGSHVTNLYLGASTSGCAHTACVRVFVFIISLVGAQIANGLGEGIDLGCHGVELAAGIAALGGSCYLCNVLTNFVANVNHVVH